MWLVSECVDRRKQMIRNVLGVIVGYLVFAVSAVLLFKLSGIDPRADPTVQTVILVVAYGSVFSAFGGFLAAAIAATRVIIVNYVLAAIMAAFAAFSLFSSSGSHYTQLAAIFLFAPASLVGGYLSARRRLNRL